MAGSTIVLVATVFPTMSGVAIGIVAVVCAIVAAM